MLPMAAAHLSRECAWAAELRAFQISPQFWTMFADMLATSLVLMHSPGYLMLLDSCMCSFLCMHFILWRLGASKLCNYDLFNLPVLTVPSSELFRCASMSPLSPLRGEISSSGGDGDGAAWDRLMCAVEAGSRVCMQSMSAQVRVCVCVSI